MQENSVEIADEILFAEGEEQIRACYPVMRQLRPHLDDEQKFIAQVKRQIDEGYNLAYLQESGGVKAQKGVHLQNHRIRIAAPRFAQHVHHLLQGGVFVNGGQDRRH